VSGPKSKEEPLAIPRWIVWEAYLRVEANQGAAGVDGGSTTEFEGDLRGNLHKPWGRPSSGTCLPPPVRAVGYRRLGARA